MFIFQRFTDFFNFELDLTSIFSDDLGFLRFRRRELGFFRILTISEIFELRSDGVLGFFRISGPGRVGSSDFGVRGADFGVRRGQKGAKFGGLIREFAPVW